jgi:hypothetical protein
MAKRIGFQDGGCISRFSKYKNTNNHGLLAIANLTPNLPQTLH